MATRLFEVKLQDVEVIERLKGPEKTRFLNDLTTKSGKAIADVARKRMSDMLKPGHKYNVGASGRSSENLEVKLQESALGLVVWTVVEGDNGANGIIRRGVKAGETPSIRDLKIWATEKRISLDATNFSKYTVVKSYKRKTKKGKEVTVSSYARRAPGQMGSIRALYAIQQALYQFGTQRGPDLERGAAGAHWMELYPKGSGRFDYVVWTVKQEGYFQREMDKFTRSAVVAYVDYLASGRKQAFGKTFKSFAG